jgi:hypothetical protein
MFEREFVSTSTCKFEFSAVRGIRRFRDAAQRSSEERVMSQKPRSLRRASSLPRKIIL